MTITDAGPRPLERATYLPFDFVGLGGRRVSLRRHGHEIIDGLGMVIPGASGSLGTCRLWSMYLPYPSQFEHQVEMPPKAVYNPTL